jgi:hypothetical protein
MGLLYRLRWGGSPNAPRAGRDVRHVIDRVTHDFAPGGARFENHARAHLLDHISSWSPPLCPIPPVRPPSVKRALRASAGRFRWIAPLAGPLSLPLGAWRLPVTATGSLSLKQRYAVYRYDVSGHTRLTLVALQLHREIHTRPEEILSPLALQHMPK